MARTVRRVTNMLPQIKRFQELKKIDASRVRFVGHM